MPTRINWRESDDPNDPSGTRFDETIYSDDPGAIADRSRRYRLGLRHTTHGRRPDGTCRVCGEPWPCATPGKQARIPYGPNHPWGRPDPSALEKSRGFLADWLRDEDYFETQASIDSFGALADHVATIPLDDPRARSIARYVEPLLADEGDRIEGVLYPDGAAVRYVEETEWGGDPDDYVEAFLEALRQDFTAWSDLVRRDGEAAAWPASGLPTDATE